jgi:ankyrin repeat protein
LSSAENPVAEIWASISSGDVNRTKKLVSANRQLIDAYIPFGGGTFLHLAASKCGPSMLSELLEAGFDVNRAGRTYGDTALCCACSYGNYAAAAFLLENGAVIDVSEPTRNALFSAIVGGSLDVVRLVLNQRIDASIRYSGDSMSEIDAVAFALERGEAAIAACIADYQAEGEPVATARLLEEGMRVAKRNNRRTQS